jgi:hypothetical protein
MYTRVLQGSWNPKKYGFVRELSLARTCLLLALVTSGAVLAFLVLLLPGVFQSDAIVDSLAQTTSIELSAAFEQTSPTYITRNPDVLVTTQPELAARTAFITITPEQLVVQRFVFFGERAYAWSQYSSLDTVPAQKVLVPLTLFLVPSLLVWGTTIALASLALGVILYVAIVGTVLHVRGYVARTNELAKISLVAAIPSLLIAGATPILRLGLPLAVLLGFVFALWLVYSLVATAQLVEKRAATKFTAKQR